MIKEIKKGIIIGTIIAIALSPITVHAETKQERWIRIQKESNEKFMAGVEADGNLTQEAIDALAWGNKNKKPNKETTKSNTNITINNYYGNTQSEAKGYVYSVDEIHIQGLPTNEDGYTKAGDYGKIEVNR